MIIKVVGVVMERSAVMLEDWDSLIVGVVSRADVGCVLGDMLFSLEH
jgi:hypothetical protein